MGLRVKAKRRQGSRDLFMLVMVGQEKLSLVQLLRLDVCVETMSVNADTDSVYRDWVNKVSRDYYYCKAKQRQNKEKYKHILVPLRLREYDISDKTINYLKKKCPKSFNQIFGTQNRTFSGTTFK